MAQESKTQVTRGWFGLTLGTAFAGSTYFVLSAMFLITWISPEALGESMARYLVFVMLLEFIIIHSSAFLLNTTFGKETSWQKIKAIAPLMLIYSIFAVAISLAYWGLWPLLTFWGLQGNKALAVYNGSLAKERQKEQIHILWLISVVCYLVLAFATSLFPVPMFGHTGMLKHTSGESGMWIYEPWRPMAFGFIYFLALGVAEVLMTRRANLAKRD